MPAQVIPKLKYLLLTLKMSVMGMPVASPSTNVDEGSTIGSKREDFISLRDSEYAVVRDVAADFD